MSATHAPEASDTGPAAVANELASLARGEDQIRRRRREILDAALVHAFEAVENLRAAASVVIDQNHHSVADADEDARDTAQLLARVHTSAQKFLSECPGGVGR